jgi:hypothetical protein
MAATCDFLAMKVASDVNHPWASFWSVVDRGREKSQPLRTGAEAAPLSHQSRLQIATTLGNPALGSRRRIAARGR